MVIFFFVCVLRIFFCTPFKDFPLPMLIRCCCFFSWQFWTATKKIVLPSKKKTERQKKKNPSRRFFHSCTLYRLYSGLLGDHFVIPFERQNERKTKRLAVCNSLVSRIYFIWIQYLSDARLDASWIFSVIIYRNNLHQANIFSFTVRMVVHNIT